METAAHRAPSFEAASCPGCYVCLVIIIIIIIISIVRLGGYRRRRNCRSGSELSQESGRLDLWQRSERHTFLAATVLDSQRRERTSRR